MKTDSGNSAAALRAQPLAGILGQDFALDPRSDVNARRASRPQEAALHHPTPRTGLQTGIGAIVRPVGLSNRPDLRGDRETLRRLRAAELARWQTARAVPVRRPKPGFRSGSPTGLRLLRQATRAAEMAVWEAAPPARVVAPASPTTRRSRRLPPPRHDAGFRTETLLLLTLATAAAVGVVSGLFELSNLITGWERFAAGIHTLLG